MARHKMTEKHFAVLLAVQDGVTEFWAYSDPISHAACLDLLSYKFGGPMLTGVNTLSITGLTKAGEAALAADLAKPN